MDGHYYFCEILGPGAALFDADGDGDLDAYLVQGGPLPPPEGKADLPRDRLFLNRLETGELRFVDVTEASGLVGSGYGMGVAAGDIDNDGRIDLYVTQLGSNRLWRSSGSTPDGIPTYEDITEASGADDPRWSSSAAFLDFDRDGWLDLLVVNYVDFRIANHGPCYNELGSREYCGPRSYLPQTDRLLRNLGPDATGRIRFRDVSDLAGMASLPGPGLGVVTADFDGDGRVDIYVANDQASNHLWINRSSGPGDVAFREEALSRGCAVDGRGRPQASMGVVAGDIDNDGDDDLFMTHLLREVNTLYLNDGDGLFRDHSLASGLGRPAVGYTGFGAALLDIDGDGWLDALTLNGEVRTLPEQRAAGDPLPLRQPDQLFLNQGGRFVEASHLAPALATPRVSRGLAVGDVDNDGDADALLVHNNGPAQLLLNRAADGRPWLGLRLLARATPAETARRDMLGATAILHRPGEPSLHRRADSAAGYLSAHDPRILFGLGAGGRVGRVEVRWPSGRRETWDGLGSGRYHTLEEGSGQPIRQVAR